MSCGFIVDGDGYKMSKSRGNVIDPAKVVAEFGADVLRLWVGSIDYSQDVGIDDEIIKRTSEAYRRIRNTFRFLLSNLNDFDYRTDCVSWDQLNSFDKWAMVRLRELMHYVTQAYDAFKFHVVYHAIYDYIVTDLSAIYLDALKDRLYSDAPNSVQRRSSQTVLMHVLEVLVRQLAPILSFTCDEVWDNYPDGLRSSHHDPAVMLAGWPEDSDFTPAVPTDSVNQIKHQFETVLLVREAVTKALEESRGSNIIGKSQEAAIIITAPAEVVEVLQSLEPGLLEEVFIVASVAVVLTEQDHEAPLHVAQSEPDNSGDIQIKVSKADGQKCPRCWNIRDLGHDPNHPDLCERCAAVVNQ
jgi:isoleucyl-tRNA synthetase